MTTTEPRVEEQPTREVGTARRRKEDARLITGRTRWTDNIQLTGMLHIAMVRSPIAHARIADIDTSAAKAAENVVAVLTGADLAEVQGSLPNSWSVTPDQKTPPHMPVAVDRVRFAGEVVAVVVARSAAEARDAADLVDVDYDELPVVLDLKEAVKDEVLVHPDLGTNVSAVWRFDSAEEGTGSSVEDAIREARGDGIVIEREYRQQRMIPAFMEPRSFMADPTGDQLVIWTSTQVPHFLRIFASLALGIPESKLRVVAPDVGGGFGGKLQVTPEEYITLIAARHTGKPCKYTETRSESLMSGHHGRDQWQRLTLSATKDGRVTGFKVDQLVDMGAYLGLVGSAIPILGAFMYNGIYKFPAYQLTFTN
ncbi:MAG: xanthine dehydrogenase family protein molybdopterin-binding subunit, partial [Nocardioidaceae bacterium]